MKRITPLLLALTLLLTACTDAIGDRYVGFAKCLTEKNTVMYGAFWCPHCANQKKIFGTEGFREIKYVECDPRGAKANPALCQAKKVQGYPTWEFADGSMKSGELTLEELSEKTSCPLPDATNPESKK